MKIIDSHNIKLDKVKTELDEFVIRISDIINKHCSYVIVSGFVSILFGRSRATEDIDYLIDKIGKEQFSRMFTNLIENGFYCMNSDNAEDAFEHMNENLALRFAENNKMIPNAEIKFVKNEIDKNALDNRMKIIMPFGIVYISPIEQQIIYKRHILKSDKDLEDARHLEIVFKDHLDSNKMSEFRKMVEK